jgi:hypothetical protein
MFGRSEGGVLRNSSLLCLSALLVSCTASLQQDAPAQYPAQGLAGQTLVSDGKGGVYFSGAYQYPLSADVPVDIAPAPLVGLDSQFMAVLADRGAGYLPSSRYVVGVSAIADSVGSGMQVEILTDAQGRATSASIKHLGQGYRANEVLALAGGSARILLKPFGLYVSANTPFELGSVPATVPRIGGEGASPVAKWLGGDASFSFQLATEQEAGGKDLYYMGFADTFIGDYHGVPFNTFYGQRGTEAYFINNSFALYDLKKFAATPDSQGWKVPQQQDLGQTIQYYWGYTDVYDFGHRDSSSKYATLPASFFINSAQPDWEMWQMTGLRVRGESRFVTMAYNNGSSADLTTLISVDTHNQWHKPYVDGRELQWDTHYHALPETLSKVTSTAFSDGSGYVAWTTAMIYSDGTVGAALTAGASVADANQVYLIGAAGTDCVLARGNLSEMAKGDFSGVELWMESGQWLQHTKAEGLALMSVLKNTGGLNTGAGFYFNQAQQRWYTWVIPFTAPGNRQVGANFFEMYRSSGADITSEYEFFQSVYQIPDPLNGGSGQNCSGMFGCNQLNDVQWLPYNITVHPQLHSDPDQVLPLVYNINYGSLSQGARGASTLFMRGGDAIYRPIVVGNEFK